MVVKPYQQDRKGEDKHIGSHKYIDGSDYLMFHNLSIHGYLAYSLGMKKQVELFIDRFQKDHEAGYLNSASRTSGAGAYKHQHDENRPGNLGPGVKICGGKAVVVMIEPTWKAAC